MRFLKNLFLLVIVSVIVPTSCKNDLELNAPYKEIPSIYAVMNADEKIQMIRVNKVFLGEGDANVMAKVSDSVNYGPGELTITLTRYYQGAQWDACPTCPSTDPNKRVITFRDSMIQTNPGAFTTAQRVYVTGADLRTVQDPNTTPVTYTVFGDYVLTVKNNKTGNVFTAKSIGLSKVPERQGYQPFAEPFYPYAPGTDPKYYIDYSTQDGSISFAPSAGAQIYQIVIRSHYYDSLANGLKYFSSVDYVFGNRYPKEAEKLSGALFIRTRFKGSDYFSGTGAALGKKNLLQGTAGRKMYLIEYFVHSSTQEYLDYLEYAKPSLSFNQNKPLYSNFENNAALGIFTFRATSSVKKEMARSFINAFATHPSTKNYGFVVK